MAALVGGAAGSLEQVREALTLSEETKSLVTYGVGIGAFGAALGLGVGAAFGAFGLSAEANQSGVQLGTGGGTSSGIGGGTSGAGLTAPTATQ